MAAQPAPPKPWETRRVLGGLPASSFQSADLRTTITRPGQPALTRVPPPVLPRPSQQTRTSSLNAYRPAYSSFSPSFGSYGSYGSSLYGGYSPYNYGYGNALGYNRFQTDDATPSRFVRQAEESSRGAFQSIESIVQAFASVSMMMDATFSAVYNSFRAVLDVANHFSRLKVHFTKVFSAFALVRTIGFLYRRLQRLLGLRRGSENEDLWTESEGTVARLGSENDATNSTKSWPIFLFFAVILGGPYLIWKLLSSGNEESTEENLDWASGEGDHVVGRAEYDFAATSDEELSFHAGDMLNLAPKEHQPKIRGWLLGSLDGQTTGFVPANYIKILGKRRGRKAGEAEKRQEQQAFPNNPPLSAVSSVATLEDQEAALESVFVETRSTGPGVETSSSHRAAFDL
ncbi:Peroxisomal membrane protein PEX13 [Aquarana catesbeiana]|uniref:Peroxisomal membrane protein PEX13 n=1 Tax=Aquarana catesbeiana TaxID=8400 RepID=A0A2G9SFW8_AQUCT|nr:Peroxisomal membrane protein PEX13 [Aquarana catesbeiana]